MAELHPSISAVGAHLDREVEATVISPRTRENQEVSTTKHGLSVERGPRISSTAGRPEPTPSEADLWTEEMMHLDQ